MTKRKPLSSMLAEDFSEQEKAFLDGIKIPEKKEPQVVEPQPVVTTPEVSVAVPVQAVKPKIPTSRSRKERGGESRLDSSDLVSRLKAPEKERTSRFTADLSETLQKKLSAVAYKSGCTKVQVVRMILEDALKDVEV